MRPKTEETAEIDGGRHATSGDAELPAVTCDSEVGGRAVGACVAGVEMLCDSALKTQYGLPAEWDRVTETPFRLMCCIGGRMVACVDGGRRVRYDDPVAPVIVSAPDEAGYTAFFEEISPYLKPLFWHEKERRLCILLLFWMRLKHSGRPSDVLLDTLDSPSARLGYLST